MQPVDDVAFATSLQHFTERFQHAAIGYPNAHDDTRQQRLSRVELDLIRTKRQHSNRFGFAVLLLHFKSHGRFPRTAFELEPGLVADVLAQLDIETVPMVLTERTAERHRAEIRALLGFREATVADGEVLMEWLRDHAVADSRDMAHLTGALEQRCRGLKIEPPGADRIERIVRAGLHAHDERFCGDIHARLPTATRSLLDALLKPVTTEPTVAAREESDGHVPAVLTLLRADPGGPSVNSLQTELAKLDLIRKLELPADLFDREGLGSGYVQKVVTRDPAIRKAM